MSALAVSTLLGLAVAGTSLGAPSLALSQHGFLKLRQQFDGYMDKFEVSMRLLQESHSSLANVAMQNRRGLNLLFLQQGGLCKALREECCFYVDTSGKVIQNLNDIRKDSDSTRYNPGSAWFEQWFNLSP